MAKINENAETQVGGEQRGGIDREREWMPLTLKYLRALPEQLEEIMVILKRKDYTTIKKHAHRIKGTSSTYRLDDISKSVTHLEQLAESGNEDAMASVIIKLQSLVDREISRVDALSGCPAEKNGEEENG